MVQLFQKSLRVKLAVSLWLALSLAFCILGVSFVHFQSKEIKIMAGGILNDLAKYTVFHFGFEKAKATVGMKLMDFLVDWLEYPYHENRYGLCSFFKG